MKGELSFTTIVLITLGIVVFAGVIFGVSTAVGGIDKTECAVGIGNCDNNKDQELPNPNINPADITFTVKINDRIVNNIAELQDGQTNTITINAPEGRDCQVIILVNNELYIERGKSFLLTNKCSEEFFITTNELKTEHFAELEVILYKQGVTPDYNNNDYKEKNQKISVRIV